MKNGYNSVKNPATIKAQIDKLRSRGCVIEDEERAEFVLSNINYYRLVHYFSVFLDGNGSYRDGTTFEKVMRVYDFDRFIAEDILNLFSKYQVTTFCAPPTMYRFFIREDLSKYDLSSVRHGSMEDLLRFLQALPSHA